MICDSRPLIILTFNEIRGRLACLIARNLLQARWVCAFDEAQEDTPSRRELAEMFYAGRPFAWGKAEVDDVLEFIWAPFEDEASGDNPEVQHDLAVSIYQDFVEKLRKRCEAVERDAEASKAWSANWPLSAKRT